MYLPRHPIGKMHLKADTLALNPTLANYIVFYPVSIECPHIASSHDRTCSVLTCPSMSAR